jgi:hypothetical protein
MDMTNHSKEEIRKVVLDLLSGRERVLHTLNQFRNLEHGVAEVFAKREGPGHDTGSEFPHVHHLSEQDQEKLLEVFWDLFLERILTLGSDHVNYEFPYFRIHSSATDRI